MQTYPIGLCFADVRGKAKAAVATPATMKRFLGLSQPDMFAVSLVEFVWSRDRGRRLG